MVISVTGEKLSGSGTDTLHLYEAINESANTEKVLQSIQVFCERAVYSSCNANKRNIHRILKDAIAYMESHYMHSLTLTQVSDHAFVSTYYLSRMFKRENGGKHLSSI